MSICATLIVISHYLEAKFDYSHFISLLHYGSTILHKKIQVISSKNQGKGAVDGVGSTVKRQVMAEVITKKVIIKTTEDYADTAETVCSGVTIIHISKEEVLGMKKQLDEEVFTDTRTLNGTRKVHHLEVVGPSKVEYYPFKGSSIKKVHNFK